MFKKIVYIVIAIIVIIILALAWRGSKGDTPSTVTENQTEDKNIQNESPKAINDEIDNIQIDSGIDTDLNSMDKDIKTL